jgi:hypothetical protein
MKKLALFALALALFTPARAAGTPANAFPRFYGTITSIDHNQSVITAHNKKRNADLSVKWDGETQVLDNKQNILPADLKVGQFVMVSYAEEGNQNHAKKISVRKLPTPHKKKVDAAE